MAERRANDPFGFLGFPFMSGSNQKTRIFNVQQTEEGLMIEWALPEFQREEIQIEFVRNGLVLIAQKKKSDEEEGSVPQRLERFIPVYFPFTENDVVASLNEENILQVNVSKNDSNRTFITIQ